MNISMNLIALFIGLLMSLSAIGSAGAEDSGKLIADLYSHDPAVRMAAVERLGKTKNKEAVNALIGIVADRDDDWRLQIRAMKELDAVDDPKFIETLIDLLNDPFVSNTCPALKWNAALALGSFSNNPKVLDALLYSLQDSDLYVREAVIESLGRLRDKRAVPYLIDALNDKSFAIKYSAVKALGKLKDPEATSYLRRIAQSDKDPLLKNEALSILNGAQ